MVRNWKLDIYRYQLQHDHLPMATSTGDPIFTDIEENGAIYRWRIKLGIQYLPISKHTGPFTDGVSTWGGTKSLWCNQTRRLPTTSGDLDFINKETKHDQTFTDDWDETRRLPTSKDDVYRHPKTTRHLPMTGEHFTKGKNKYLQLENR